MSLRSYSRGDAGAEIMVPSVENLSGVTSKPVAGQCLAMHDLPTAMNFFLVLFSTFAANSASDFPKPLSTFSLCYLSMQRSSLV